MQRQLVFFLFFAMLTLSNVDSSAGRSAGPNKRLVRQCVSDDELANAVVLLSRQYDEAQVAQRLLRQSAKRSSACRRQVVAAVANDLSNDKQVIDQLTAIIAGMTDRDRKVKAEATLAEIMTSPKTTNNYSSATFDPGPHADKYLSDGI